MPFLLDTNVVSETMRPAPDPHVLAWLERQAPRDIYLAAMTIGELVRGARRLATGARRDRLESWLERDLAAQFEGRILPFDGPAACLWGEMMGDGDRRGRPLPAADAQIAAVALRNGLTIATRNIRDFGAMPVDLFDPWRFRPEA